MNSRIGYLAEKGYAADGNVIRHGDALRDMVVDYDKNIRVLGMIGLYDADEDVNNVLSGTAPLAYMMLAQNGSIVKSKVRLTDPLVSVYGLDTNVMDIKQAIRLEMFGYTALTVITLRGGGVS